MTQSKLKNKKKYLYRINFFLIPALLFHVFLIASLIRTSFVNAEQYENIKERYGYTSITIKPERGDIKDAKGNILATTILTYDIDFDTNAPKLTDSLFYSNIDSLAYLLEKHNGTHTAEKYKEYFIDTRKNPSIFTVAIARDISLKEVEQIKQFPIFREKSIWISGFTVTNKQKRVQPYGHLLRRTIGTVREESGVTGTYGESGLEGYYEESLSGIPYTVRGIKLPGSSMPSIDYHEFNARKGVNLITGIDINLQNYAQQAVKEQLLKTDAKAATLVVMETETGYINAMVNLRQMEDSTVREIENYAAGQSLAPGSTFKIPVLIAALEDGRIKPDDLFDTSPGVIELHGETIRDGRNLGILNTKQLISYSSNVGMAKMVNDNYIDAPDQLIRRLYDMNIAEPTGIDVYGERSPRIHSSKPGSSINRFSFVSMAYGYGIRITPIGMLTFYNAIANDGYMVKPRIVKALEQNGQIIKEFKPSTDAKLICSKNTLDIIKQALIEAVQDRKSTAYRIYTDQYQIAGKTGTTKYFDTESNQFIDKYRASFVGYFPANKPKYSMIVVFYEIEDGDYTGGAVAAPVFRKVADKIYKTDKELNASLIEPADMPTEAPLTKSGNRNDIDRVLANMNITFAVGIENSGNWIRTEQDRFAVNYHPMNFSRETVPSVLDMSAKDAVYLLESFGIDVQMSGAGTVRYQSIQPGTFIRDNMTIKIELK